MELLSTLAQAMQMLLSGLILQQSLVRLQWFCNLLDQPILVISLFLLLLSFFFLFLLLGFTLLLFILLLLFLLILFELLLFLFFLALSFLLLFVFFSLLLLLLCFLLVPQLFSAFMVFLGVLSSAVLEYTLEPPDHVSEPADRYHATSCLLVFSEQ